MKAPLVAFKAARLFSPRKAQILKLTMEMIDTLSAFSFLKDKISDIKLELPLYLSQCCDVPESTDCLEWWKIHATQLPVWSSATKLILLVQPSSVAAERVFSLFKLIIQKSTRAVSTRLR